MQEYGEVKLQVPFSSNSVPDGGEWSCSRHLPLYPPKKGSQYPLNTRLGGHQSPSGRLGKQKSIAPIEQHAPISLSPIPHPRRHGIILKCILTGCEDERIHVLQNRGQLKTHVSEAQNLRIRKRQARISDLPSNHLLFQQPAANGPQCFK